MKNINSNLSWSKQVVNLLYQKGVRYACISPGSRNSPLIYQFSNNSKIQCYSHLDERSGSFFALGLAKKTKSPVVILTTSGTATANLFPAIIESSMSMIPIIIITADRPKNLINTGENQTINQTNIYGHYVRASIDISHKRTFGTLKKIDKLLNINKPSGPIHLNIRFNEPLMDKENVILKYTPQKPKNKIKKTSITLPLFKRPMIICGGLSKNNPTKILNLANKINSPIFTDILSNMRNLNSNKIKVYYEHYIDDLKYSPDLILRFGRKPISKKLCQFLNKHNNKTVLIEPDGYFNDNCKNIIKSSLDNIILKFSSKNSTNEKWITDINNNEKKIKEVISSKNEYINSEPNLIRLLKKCFKNEDYLFIGNSTPIRSFDQYSGKFIEKINIFANRGASGIDGLTSTALGMAETNKLSKNYLVIGDVSLFHDSNAFQIKESFSSNLTIIVINNKGGQIFSKLSYSNKNIKDFQKYWITPPKAEIKDLADLYKIKYYKLKLKDIKNKLNKISSYNGIKIIEVIIDASKDNIINSK